MHVMRSLRVMPGLLMVIFGVNRPLHSPLAPPSQDRDRLDRTLLQEIPVGRGRRHLVGVDGPAVLGGPADRGRVARLGVQAARVELEEAALVAEARDGHADDLPVLEREARRTRSCGESGLALSVRARVQRGSSASRRAAASLPGPLPQLLLGHPGILDPPPGRGARGPRSDPRRRRGGRAPAGRPRRRRGLPGSPSSARAPLGSRRSSACSAASSASSALDYPYSQNLQFPI